MLKGWVAWWGKNPVAGNLVMIIAAVLGLISYFSMEKEFFPPGRDNSVRVEAVWPGASPREIEEQVTLRIEEALSGLDGAEWVRSRSMEGFAWTNISANASVDMDAFTAEVRERVSSIVGFPAALEPPRVTQNSGGAFMQIISVHGDVDERLLRDTAKRVRDEIALLPGASQTQIIGGVRQPEVSLEVSEAQLRRFNLTFDEVAQAVRTSSINTSAGTVRTDEGRIQLRARNLADTQIDFENIVIRQSADGASVRVKDVATVIDGFEDVDMNATMNGERAVTLFTNTPEKADLPATSEAIRAYIEKLKPQLPEGVGVSLLFDQAEDFSALLSILLSNALQGFGLIFLLLLLTLHPKVAIWATIGVMTAFAGSFIILPYLGVSLNFLSVFGFLLVLGIMVDDAIIVGEAVYERVEKGEEGADAAIYATQLILKPLVASVLVTMIAFSPFMFISEASQFTRGLSIVVMSTLFFSLIESLFILPAHLAHVKPLKAGPGFLGRLAGAQLACAASVIWVAENIYGPFMRLCVRFRWITLAAFLAVFALAIGLNSSGRVKQSFMPEVEGDFMMVSIDMPQTTPWGRLVQVADQLDRARIALEAQTKDVAVLDPNTGQKSLGVVRSWSQGVEGFTVRAYVALTPPETRELRSSAVTEKLKGLMGEVPDAERMSFELSGNDGGPAIQIALLSDDQDALRAAAEELKQRLLKFQQITSVRDSEEAAIEELLITLKPGAEQLGIDLAGVSRQIRQAYFGEEVQRLPREGDFVRVYVRYPESERESLDSLRQFRIRTADGREVPFEQVANAEFAPGVTGLDRRQRQRTMTIEAELPQEERANVMNALRTEKFFETLEAKFPTVKRRAIGQEEGQQEFLAELGRLGALALLAMFFLLAVTFRSYSQPLLIMSAIPFAFVGAVFAHWMFGTAFALFSWLGMVAAMGVIVNDNVVLVDKANQFREEGQDAYDAVTNAGVSRFRQIFLTSVTEFVGLAPMLFEMAAIAQFLKPMALSLAFGVLLAMPATLILTPVLYMCGRDLKQLTGGIIRFVWRGFSPARTQPAE